MSDITKKDSSLMMLAQAIGGLNILEPPEMPNNQSWLPRKFTKSKLKDLKEMSEMLAATYENNARALVAKLNGATAMMTASDRLKLEFKTIEHQTKMLDFEEMKMQALVIQEQGKANKISLECRLLEIDIKDADLTFKAKSKEMGYDSQDEAGE